jgi:hypothetical protein
MLKPTVFVSMALLAAGLSARQKPNFSGVWKLNETRTAVKALGPRQIVFRIDHKDPVFKYTATGKVGNNQDFSETYECSTASKAARDPSQIVAEGEWEGDTLALRYFKGGAELIKFTFRLSEDGKQMIREGGHREKIYEVYDKQ